MVATMDKPVIRQREFLTPAEFAAIIGISERYAHKLAQTGQIAGVKVGTKTVRIPVTEVDRLLSEATRKGR